MYALTTSTIDYRSVNALLSRNATRTVCPIVSTLENSSGIGLVCGKADMSQGSSDVHPLVDICVGCEHLLFLFLQTTPSHVIGQLDKLLREVSRVCVLLSPSNGLC